MKRLLSTFVFLSLSAVAFQARAVFTEVGVSYGKKKNSFDADNYVTSESLTASLSFYFMETLALELSYTSAVGVQQEKIKSGATIVSERTVVQTTQIQGADLIWVLAGKQAFFQPYLKGGAAQLRRTQEVKLNNLETYTLDPEVALVPSYGVGFKLAFTSQFGVKVSYDAWKTPLGEGLFSNDDAIRAGVTWMF
ncbi:MAG: outer membrane beta-barrel protein [Bdellovibrionaceae bacterium]|nr:outer membrane beta-barrel protein [Pseudobdellovibrionaceae bacterium]MBX3034824.1 outer membrane beta-barrel protein [Pseudobdellovibrionaceae bacterium]